MLLEKKAGENLEENMYIQTYHLSVEGFITRYLKQKNEVKKSRGMQKKSAMCIYSNE